MSPPEKQAQLPHHKLIAYPVALQLVQLVARIRIGDAQLRAQARKSAASSVGALSRKQSRGDRHRRRAWILSAHAR